MPHPKLMIIIQKKLSLCWRTGAQGQVWTGRRSFLFTTQTFLCPLYCCLSISAKIWEILASFSQEEEHRDALCSSFIKLQALHCQQRCRSSSCRGEVCLWQHSLCLSSLHAPSHIQEDVLSLLLN